MRVPFDLAQVLGTAWSPTGGGVRGALSRLHAAGLLEALRNGLEQLPRLALQLGSIPAPAQEQRPLLGPSRHGYVRFSVSGMPPV